MGARIQPWTRTRASTPATFASPLAFIEQAFSLPPLNPCATADSWDPFCSDDVQAPANVNGGVTYGYQDAFDFDQVPLGPAAIVHTRLTQAQRTYLREHPYEGDEAT
jgi:hypothetical protein